MPVRPNEELSAAIAEVSPKGDAPNGKEGRGSANGHDIPPPGGEVGGSRDTMLGCCNTAGKCWTCGTNTEGTTTVEQPGVPIDELVAGLPPAVDDMASGEIGGIGSLSIDNETASTNP